MMDHISVRLKPNQYLVLTELSEVLDTSISMLVRTMVGSWLCEHENDIYRIIDRKKLEKDANYKPIEEDEEDIFGDN